MVDLFETPRDTLLRAAKTIRDGRLVQSAAFVQQSAIIPAAGSCLACPRKSEKGACEYPLAD
jgi:hypothetical protein